MLFPFSPTLVIFALRYWLPSFLVLILVMKAMATEFIKNCCKGLLSKEKEAEPEGELTRSPIRKSPQIKQIVPHYIRMADLSLHI